MISSCSNVSDTPKECTAESRICSDGSSVGRNPNNNCQFYPCPENELDEPAMAQDPYLTIEATVSSIVLSDLPLNCERIETCPKDKVTLKINKIDKSRDPDNQISLKAGDELEALELKYTARPSKLLFDIPPKCPPGQVLYLGSCIRQGCEGPECPISSPEYEEKPVEQIGDYIVFHLPQQTNEVTEKVLPGLEEGSTIRFIIWAATPPGNEIEVYDLV